MDVVAANPNEWTVDPFAGTVKDGCVYGRGAYDMKCMTAIEIMVIKLLKKNNIKLKGDMVLAATADEEKAAKKGRLPSKAPQRKSLVPICYQRRRRLSFSFKKRLRIPSADCRKRNSVVKNKGKGNAWTRFYPKHG